MLKLRANQTQRQGLGLVMIQLMYILKRNDSYRIRCGSSSFAWFLATVYAEWMETRKQGR